MEALYTLKFINNVWGNLCLTVRKRGGGGHVQEVETSDIQWHMDNCFFLLSSRKEVGKRTLDLVRVLGCNHLEWVLTSFEPFFSHLSMWMRLHRISDYIQTPCGLPGSELPAQPQPCFLLVGSGGFWSTICSFLFQSLCVCQALCHCLGACLDIS